MDNAESEGGDIFHIDNFRKLVELMAEHDLNEVEMRRGNTRVRLRRGFPAAPAPMAEMPRMPAAPTAASMPPATAAAAAATPTPAAADEHLLVLRSPMVGTFYAQANPESPPYVKVGDQVGPETTMCLIEAMKVFNEIPAEASGKVVAILVENGDPVEFGQPLFKLDTRG